MESRAKRRSSRLTPTQARAARRVRRQRRRRFFRAAAVAAIGVIAFLFIISLFAGNLPIRIGEGPGPAYQGKSVPLPPGYTSLVTPHLQIGEPHPAYTSKPATSGWHYGPLVDWGIHDEPVADEYLAHKLEHAGVGIHYNCPDGCEELIANLAEIVSRAPRKVIMSPYAGMDTRIALTAWTNIDQFNEFDEDRIIAFINAHLDSSDAPEPFGM